MVFDVPGLINLILYCVQQLGVALGLGAQTIMLAAYVIATRDGVIDDVEAQFLRATRRTLYVALSCIALSGLAITALHLAGGQADVVAFPAYLFKLLLIGVVIALTALLHTLPETIAEGLLGGTWYALFLVHILAPVTTWSNLLTLWGVWLVGFNLIWYVIIFSTRQRQHEKRPEVKKQKLEPKPEPRPHRSLFSFFTFAKAPKSVEQPLAAPVPEASPVPSPAPAPQPQYQAIKLDPGPQLTVPAPVPVAPAPASLPVVPPIPAAPAVQIKTEPAPAMALPQEPVEKMPANKTTDTPFLPQVPPLQPIPVIPPTTPAAPQGTAPTPAPVGTVAQPAPVSVPEVKLGLNIMPKSPDQLK